MAVVFTQTPTTPNGSQSTVLYGVANISTGSQAKYICDVKYEGSNETLVRIKQPANNNGYGVFEISEILHDYTDYDEPFKTSGITNSSNNNVVDFSIEFGEEYGSSPSSSLTVLASQITSSLTIYPAVTEYTEGFNWPSSSYYTNYLTNSPDELYVKPSEYGTLSHINISGGSVTGVTIAVYNESNTLLVAKSLVNNFNTSTTSNKLIHIPAGPQNFKDDANLYILTGSSWSYYNVITQPGNRIKEYYRLDECVSQNGKRFAFINKLGVFDYYSTTLTNNQTEQYQSDTYEQSFIDFSTTDGTITFSPSRRGTTVYNKKIDETFTAQTDWLTTEQVDWLVELFQSPSVFIQEGNEFLPVIITNNSAQKKTNPRGQKLFTYTIEYKLANPRRARR
jgi:hypothetical protein